MVQAVEGNLMRALERQGEAAQLQLVEEERCQDLAAVSNVQVGSRATRVIGAV